MTHACENKEVDFVYIHDVIGDSLNIQSVFFEHRVQTLLFGSFRPYCKRILRACTDVAQVPIA